MSAGMMKKVCPRLVITAQVPAEEAQLLPAPVTAEEIRVAKQ